MANLLASLATAGGALRAYQQALDVIQNNITNAATPGFAKQSLVLEAQPFDLAGGLAGGVAARDMSSARDEYAEEEVRRQMQSLGRFAAQAQGASAIENLFDVSGDSGVAADLNALSQSFSAWSVAPSSAAARQAVLAAAGRLADDVRGLAGQLEGIARNAQDDIASTVHEVDRLAGVIRDINAQRPAGSSDPASDALLHSSLEQLSELIDVDTISQADGTVSVLLKGGAPLVVGDSLYPISAGLAGPDGAANPLAPPSSLALDWQGADITSQIQGGKLGGLLDVRNRMLAGLLGDGQSAGSLNDLARAFADAVNGILQSGFTAPGSGAAPGAALFVYDASDAARAASSFAVNPDLHPEDLAPVDAHGDANGNALQLAALASDPSAGVGGRTFSGAFSEIVAAAGRESAAASENSQVQRKVADQARALRDQSSGVSLDEQAVLLLQFQRSYQAAAQLLTVLNGMMDATINMLRP